MCAAVQAPPSPFLSQFASGVAEGLAQTPQKKLSPALLYDDLGSALFEAITLVPEYELTRADERLLASVSDELAETVGPLSLVAELGSGSGKKTRHILRALIQSQSDLVYLPIDVSPAALSACSHELADLVEVRPITANWTDGLESLESTRTSDRPLLVLFLGSSIGNIDRADLSAFFASVRCSLRPNDYFLLGADLLKPIDRMLQAYDDSTGVTAAFNKNVLNRINRELGAEFDLASFEHKARWSETERRIEMHLVSRYSQSIAIAALDTTIHFRAGESIWTESSHKFTVEELTRYAAEAGFSTERCWVDQAWPFAEVLWRARP